MRIRTISLVALGVAGVIAAIAIIAAPTFAATATAPRPPIVKKYIVYGGDRKAQTADYSQRHYHQHTYKLTNPKVVVLHHTGGRRLAERLVDLRQQHRLQRREAGRLGALHHRQGRHHLPVPAPHRARPPRHRHELEVDRHRVRAGGPVRQGRPLDGPADPEPRQADRRRPRAWCATCRPLRHQAPPTWSATRRPTTRASSRTTPASRTPPATGTPPRSRSSARGSDAGGSADRRPVRPTIANGFAAARAGRTLTPWPSGSTASTSSSPTAAPTRATTASSGGRRTRTDAMTLAQLTSVIDQAAELGLTDVYFEGGEPTLAYPDRARGGEARPRARPRRRHRQQLLLGDVGRGRQGLAGAVRRARPHRPLAVVLRLLRRGRRRGAAAQRRAGGAGARPPGERARGRRAGVSGRARRLLRRRRRDHVQGQGGRRARPRASGPAARDARHLPLRGLHRAGPRSRRPGRRAAAVPGHQRRQRVRRRRRAGRRPTTCRPATRRPAGRARGLRPDAPPGHPRDRRRRPVGAGPGRRPHAAARALRRRVPPVLRSARRPARRRAATPRSSPRASATPRTNQGGRRCHRNANASGTRQLRRRRPPGQQEALPQDHLRRAQGARQDRLRHRPRRRDGRTATRPTPTSPPCPAPVQAAVLELPKEETAEWVAKAADAGVSRSGSTR